MLEKILMLNTLKNQFILNPLDDPYDIVRYAIGIQAQYLNNALFAIKIRNKSVVTELDKSVIRKVWSFRGTLHIHIASDTIPIVSVLRNAWYDCWGKYMLSIFTYNERKCIRELVFRLIETGFCNRQMLRDECMHLGLDAYMIESAFSSWGGILKDLNYDGKICFTEYNKADFSVSNEKLLGDKESVSFGPELMKRYFGFYGPATISDFCYWAGIYQSLGKQWFEPIEKELEYIQDERKNKYYYKGRINYHINELPKCVFLGGFDPLMLAYKDKSRWLKLEHHDGIFKKNGFIQNVILIDGMAEAIWKVERAALKITLFKPSLRKKQIIGDFVRTSNVLACKSITYDN